MTDRKGKRLRQLLAGIDNVYFNIKSERHSYYQALLSLGDRRVAPAIEAAERNGGNWRAAVAETGVDADFYIFRDRIERCRPAVGHHRRRHEERRSSRPSSRRRSSEEWTLPPKRQKENSQFLPVLSVGPVTAARSRRLRRGRPLRPRTPRRPAGSDRASAPATSVSVDRTQQREAATLAVDRVLPRGKRDVAAAAGLPLPHGEADQLQPFERARGEVQLRVRQLAGGLPLSLGTNLTVTVSLL